MLNHRSTIATQNPCTLAGAALGCYLCDATPRRIEETMAASCLLLYQQDGHHDKHFPQ